MPSLLLKSIQNQQTNLTLALTATLLITGCATTKHTANGTAQNTSANGVYSFPAELDNGYWAMTDKIMGTDTIVVDFNGNSADNYLFKCGPNGTYRQINVETVSLIPSATGMQVKYANEPIFSELQLVDYTPKQFLTLEQKFVHPDIINAPREEKEFSYRYTSVLTPICG